MKKSTIFKWFFPFAAFIVYLIIFLWIKPAIASGEQITHLLDMMPKSISANWGLPELPAYFISNIIQLTLILAIPICALCCVGSTVGFATRHMGESSYETDAGYYEVKWDDDDTMTIDRASDIHVTWAGLLRFLMFFTYLFWFIPVFIVQYKKAKRFANRQS